ncbi:hypothetical protein [Pseudochryseolinea flava]|uniref:Uncharacterized protein n=1 Tax=Pseudochryseolinea flava TaxID=2059302 RepID=A0A364XVN5_9BACT|nr:hypothetical protein [Pseudochryseolinea flava]RAV98239.1 hypothetical protein DQQ10_24875 [Pseudochryseolinea flava]
MFNGPDYPKSLDEDVFDVWLEKGREQKLGYHCLIIIWDEYDAAYKPIYAEHRDEISKYPSREKSTGREWLVAAYDLYSESRVA